MIDSLIIKNASATAQIAVNDDVNYPVERFVWNPDMIGEDHPNLKGPGRHANFKEIEAMSIIMEGHIKADTVDNYWTARKNLLDIVIPDYTQTLPAHGSILFTQGDGETYVQRVHLVTYDVPLEALYPTVTPFRFEWDGLDGYWLKMSSFTAAKI